MPVFTVRGAKKSPTLAGMPAPRRAPSPARKDFGEKVQAARRLQGLSLEDLAERSGMNWSYIAQIERGERNISIDNMAALAAALELPLREVL